LVILAASLFTVAHIQGWSARHEREYRELDNEERASGAFLAELRAEDMRPEAVASRSPFAGALSNVSGTMAGRVAGLLTGGILALALVSASGCATAVKSASVPEAAVAAGPAAAILHTFVDTSGSCVRPALTEAWDTVRWSQENNTIARVLPGLSEHWTENPSYPQPSTKHRKATLWASCGACRRRVSGNRNLS